MINEQIRDKEVRVIGEEGQQLGIMSSRDAMKLAKDAGLDLVKIAPTAKPPVCKIVDYGKFRYEHRVVVQPELHALNETVLVPYRNEEPICTCQRPRPVLCVKAG